MLDAADGQAKAFADLIDLESLLPQTDDPLVTCGKRTAKTHDVLIGINVVIRSIYAIPTDFYLRENWYLRSNSL
jgi:hypothetical protein